MSFHKLSLDKWHRRGSFELYYQNIPCTYSIVVNLEITSLYATVKNNDLKFFPTILFGISKFVNRHEEFRMDLDEHSCLGYYDHVNPCYTVFHRETESFTDVWSEYSDDYHLFMENYNSDMNNYQRETHKLKPLNERNIFNVSCIPWTSFCGFNLNLQNGYEYLRPIFTIGKYFSEGDKKLLPLAIQVHHAICDGFHVSRFTNELQNWAEFFKL